MKCLRTNRGGDFCSNEFLKFYKDYGIKRQLTATYTPQQNGVVDKKNQTIVNMVTSMLQIKTLRNMY